jgi:hypothetical protein
VIFNFGKTPKKTFFTGGKTALDELHHANPHVVAERTRHHAECRAAFAFTVASVYQNHAALLGGSSDTRIYHLFVPLGAFAVTG